MRCKAVLFLMSTDRKDHCKAINDIMKKSVDVYASKGTLKSLGVSGHKAHPVEAMKLFSVGNFKAVPFNTQHDAAEPFGFFITGPSGEKLLYITDSFYIKNRFAGINILAIECNYSDETWMPGIKPYLKKRIQRSHFSLQNVKDFIRANDMSGCREIRLIHISKSNGDPDMFVKEIQRLTGIPTYAH